MTVFIFKRRAQGGGERDVSSQTSRGRRCAWPAVFSKPTREEVGGSETCGKAAASGRR